MTYHRNGVLQRVRSGRQRPAASAGRGDGGFTSLYVVVLTAGLIAMAGLVIDGGNALAARGLAADTAQQAARAGADALTPASLRTSSTLTADPAAAGAAADRVLTAAGITGAVRVNGDEVTVTAHVRKPTAVLSAIGLTHIDVAATATATALRGTTTEDGP